eukprot:11331880-Ditylum_brightwellii.AAC.1
MSSRRKGKCCAKELYKHEQLELCPQHKCSMCKGIVHLLCGSVDKKTAGYLPDLSALPNSTRHM